MNRLLDVWFLNQSINQYIRNHFLWNYNSIHEDFLLKAIQNYVLELQEDIEDYNDAVEALKDDSPTISLEEVIRKSGLADQIGFRDE